jgi:Heterokaryon incompatibility protein (HET)
MTNQVSNNGRHTRFAETELVRPDHDLPQLEGSFEEGSWPRRLLHVPTMTSLERTGRHHYGDFVRPSYHAVSYTWGRYTSPIGPSLPVKNVTWRIPSIKESHFSLREFDVVLQTAAEGVDLVWLDVACIDQENHAIKVDEIGRQADIFQRASKVFVWLTPLPVLDLEALFWTVEQFCKSLDSDHWEAAGYAMAVRSRRQPSRTQKLQSAIKGIMGQPWLTSLWTLQEAYLCKGAILLARSGDALTLAVGIDDDPAPLRRPMTLQWVLMRIQQIFIACSTLSDGMAKDICGRINRSGLLTLGSQNKWALYSATTKRQSKLQEDHVYGIMQVFGLRLGLYDRLEDLEEQLAFRLNHQNPVMCQMQVHNEVPTNYCAWRGSRNMVVPPIYIFVKNSHSFCKISESSHGEALYSGKKCNIEELIALWRFAFERRSVPTKAQYRVNIDLDARPSASYKSLQVDFPGDADRSELPNFNSTMRIDLGELEGFFPRGFCKHSVLFLGKVTLGNEWYRGPDWHVKHSVGLLVYEREELEGRPWVRTAVCSWQDESDDPDLANICIKSREGILEDTISAPEGMWKDFSGKLG